MKTTYRWDGKRFVDKATGAPMRSPDRIALPYIVSDITPYFSVASGEWVDGKRARRNDLRRTGCREVDPSEFKPETCRTERWARRLRKEWVPDKPLERLPTTIGPVKVD